MKPSLALIIIPALALSACGGGNDQTAAGDEGSVASNEESQSTGSVSGETAFKGCVACHTIDKGGRNGIAPNLHGVVGRQIASLDGYLFSPALKKKQGVWDEANLDAYIKDSRGFAPGNRMGFAGVKDAAERSAIIEYLKSQK